MSSEVPVYKVTLLGMAEAGKTALATQIVCSAPPTVYEHTARISSLCCEVRRPPPPEDEESDLPLRYGVELQDSPGELNDQVLTGTPEHLLMSDRSQQNPRPSNAALRARARKTTERARGDGRGTEGAPLLPDMDNRNVFARARAPAAYIVVFDALSGKSFKKAKQILSTLGKTDVQLALFANKADLIKDDDEDIRRRLEDATNLADDKDVLFMVGSALENFVEIRTGQVAERIELVTLLHELTARIGGEDWDGEDEAEGGALATGWCSFWCCAPTYG